MNTSFMSLIFLWSAVAFGAEKVNKSEMKLEDLFLAYENLVKVKERDKVLHDIHKFNLQIEDRIFDDNSIGAGLESYDDDRIYSLTFSSRVKIGFSSDSVNRKNRFALKSDQLEYAIGLSQDKEVIAKTFNRILFLYERYHEQKKLMQMLKPLIASAEKARDNGGVESIASIKWKILFEKYSASYELTTFAFANHIKKLNDVLGTKYLAIPSKLSLVRPNWSPLQLSQSRHKSIVLIESKIRSLEAEKMQEDFFDLELNAQVDVNPDSDEKTFLVGIALPISGNSKRGIERDKISTRITLLKNELNQARQNFSLFKKEYIAERDIFAKKREIMNNLNKKSKVLYESTQSGYSKGVNGFGEMIEALESLIETKVAIVELDRQIRNHDIEFLSQVGGL